MARSMAEELYNKLFCGVSFTILPSDELKDDEIKEVQLPLA